MAKIVTGDPANIRDNSTFDTKTKKTKHKRAPLKLFSKPALIIMTICIAAGYYVGASNTRADICGDLIYYQGDTMEILRVRACDINAR